MQNIQSTDLTDDLHSNLSQIHDVDGNYNFNSFTYTHNRNYFERLGMAIDNDSQTISSLEDDGDNEVKTGNKEEHILLSH